MKTLGFVVMVSLLLASPYTFAENIIRCHESNVETYLGNADVEFVFNSTNKKYSSTLTLTSDGKIIKVIKQNSFTRWTNVSAVVFFNDGNAVEVKDDGQEVEIPNSKTTFSVWTDTHYGGLTQLTLDLPNHHGAVESYTRDCEKE